MVSDTKKPRPRKNDTKNRQVTDGGNEKENKCEKKSNEKECLTPRNATKPV
jgi:hypothetical protein